MPRKSKSEYNWPAALREAKNWLNVAQQDAEGLEPKIEAANLNFAKCALLAIQKQIPMPVKEVHCDEYFCPACGSENNCDQYVVWDAFCPVCGQRLLSQDN